MIINKLIFTESERKYLITDISAAEFEMIHYKAQQKYIKSFAKKINIKQKINNDRSLSKQEKETIAQAILADINEILNAVNKQDFIDYQQQKQQIFITSADDTISDNVISDKTFETHFKPNYYSCVTFFMHILRAQFAAYEYYGLEDSEATQLINQKANEWYAMSSSSEEDAKKNDDLNESLKELPIVKRALAPEKYFLPTYKINDILFNGDFPIGIEKKVGMTSEKDKRKGKLAYTILMLSFDELDDGIKISRELTVYDQQVWNACTNLMINNYKIITPAQIYRWMGYEKQMSQTDKDRIMESINTIIRARVYINNENERKLYPKYPEISLNSPLLAAKICTAKSGKNEVNAIEMLEISDLFTVAEKRGQITTIPFELLEVPISKTDNNLQLLNYLIRRIIYMKHDNSTSRKILLNAIYTKCKIEEKKQKQRLPEKIKKILDYYKSIEWIKDHHITDQGIEIILSDKKITDTN